MSTYLLVIGTEELPADLAESVISQLEMNVSNDLNSSKIKFSEIRVTTTPRRIGLTIEGLAHSLRIILRNEKVLLFLKRFMMENLQKQQLVLLEDMTFLLKN